GAHPGGMVRVGEHFSVFVPAGRAISPVTHTNWEGTGVRPDVAVPTDHAMQTAYVAALGKVMEATTIPEIRRQLQEIATEQQRKLEEMRAARPTGG
ncbi:MAG TPA: hypothetical protein VFR81_22015, partial [Longimicrobium sp.]|nr:hypothetical protein [Longimicrobium sp.]